MGPFPFCGYWFQSVPKSGGTDWALGWGWNRRIVDIPHLTLYLAASPDQLGPSDKAGPDALPLPDPAVLQG